MKNWDNRDRAKLTEDNKIRELKGELAPALINLGVNPVKMHSDEKNRIEEDITVEKP